MQRFSACVYLLCFVDLDASAAERGAFVSVVTGAHLVVVDDAFAVVLVPDLDPERIDSPAALDIAVGSGEHEAVAAGPIDRAFALELRLVTGHHQPFVAVGVEVQITSLELELGVAVWRIGALLVLGDEAEVGFAGRRICASLYLQAPAGE